MYTLRPRKRRRPHAKPSPTYRSGCSSHCSAGRSAQVMRGQLAEDSATTCLPFKEPQPSLTLKDFNHAFDLASVVRCSNPNRHLDRTVESLIGHFLDRLALTARTVQGDPRVDTQPEGMCCKFQGCWLVAVKESRNGNPTRDLQMAANRTRPHTLCGPV